MLHLIAGIGGIIAVALGVCIFIGVAVVAAAFVAWANNG